MLAYLFVRCFVIFFSLLPPFSENSHHLNARDSLMLKFSSNSEYDLSTAPKPNIQCARTARVVQYSQIDSIGVSGDKKGLHWYQWYDWYQ